MSYNSKYTGQQVESLLDQVANGNAGGGGSGGITVELDPIFSASPAAKITDDNISSWNNKVDKVDGKQLSTEDFTTLLKQKLDGLSNYDDTTISQAVQSLQTQIAAKGTYSKPSTGIPKTDLASAVQTSLGKADTALQSEQYKGTVTSVKINGTTKTPDTNGMVDLGTIEGGGGSSSGSGAYPMVLTDASYVEMNPNMYYIIEGEVEEVQIEFSEETEGIVNEYIVQFTVAESVIGAVGDGITVSMPDTIIWANNNIPTFAFGKTYVISVVNNLACYAEF